jgi:predicted phosphodiesterase
MGDSSSVMVASEPDEGVWGLVSDVHGNYTALEQAQRVLSDAGARKLAFLGDYLGRGDSDRCVARIRQVADVAILGNRDLDWQDRVSPLTKAFVLGLPRVAQAAGLLVSHGDSKLTPSLSTTQIGRDFLKVWPEMQARGATVWAFGHSHHARVWRKSSGANAAQLLSGQVIEMEAAARYCLNVGTTGLPFAGKGGPSVALVDFTHAQIRQIPLPRV